METKDRPGVLAPPPLIYLAAFLLGWWGRGLLPRYQSIAAGAALAAAGVALAGWGVATMMRARTHVDPYKPATALVTTGPFRLTRNPLYVSLTAVYAGAALWSASMTSLLLLPAAVAILYFGVILREERYLEGKFGAAYRDYRKRVRRWL